jgi:hypothetical protein
MEHLLNKVFQTTLGDPIKNMKKTAELLLKLKECVEIRTRSDIID